MRYAKIKAAALALLLLGTFAFAQAPSLKPVTIPKTNKSDAITLPEDREVGSKTRVVSVQAETKDEKAEVQWVVFNLNDENPVEALSSGKTLLVFPNDQDDVIVVLAYTAVDGKATAPVRTLIKVVTKKPPGPKPTPKPDPEPTPPQPNTGGAVKHVTFVIDASKQTAAVASVLRDADLRKSLSDAGIKPHLTTTASAAVTEGGLSEGVKTAGGAPAVVLQDADGNILAAAKITDSAAVKALVGKYKGDQ